MKFFGFSVLINLNIISYNVGHVIQFSDQSKYEIPGDALQLGSPILNRDDVENSAQWFSSASQALDAKLKQKPIETRAKNLIMFLGDGLSVSTITASRIYKGQLEGSKFGEEAQLYMDTLPFVGTSKTYCADYQIADSSCSATAYLSGTKANYRTLGVSPAVLMNNCTSQMNEANHVSSILAWAQAAGMSTGIVTTTRITHASPAGAYAHAANRDWENNHKVEISKQDSSTCDDIAEQLITKLPGMNINVILGGGRTHFLNGSEADIELGGKNKTEKQYGARTDGKNLIQDWIDRKFRANLTNSKYITGRDELLSLQRSSRQIDYLLGLFSFDHLSFADEQLANNDPSLEEMTAVAIQLLSRNPKGYFLFVEGGRIDHAHHENRARRALAETLQFDEAIKLADGLTSDDDTLIVVTSDHSHGFTIAGDSFRGNPILGIRNGGANDVATSDGLPYTTLSYVNGKMGARPLEHINETTCARANVSSDPLFAFNYSQITFIPLIKDAKHAGEDVLIQAKGPWAHLFTGTFEQNYIPIAMAYAACINPHGANYCQKGSDNEGNQSGSGKAIHQSSFVQLISLSCLVALFHAFVLN